MRARIRCKHWASPSWVDRSPLARMWGVCLRVCLGAISCESSTSRHTLVFIHSCSHWWMQRLRSLFLEIPGWESSCNKPTEFLINCPRYSLFELKGIILKVIHFDMLYFCWFFFLKKIEAFLVSWWIITRLFKTVKFIDEVGIFLKVVPSTYITRKIIPPISSWNCEVYRAI